MPRRWALRWRPTAPSSAGNQWMGPVQRPGQAQCRPQFQQGKKFAARYGGADVPQVYVLPVPVHDVAIGGGRKKAVGRGGQVIDRRIVPAAFLCSLQHTAANITRS